MRTDRCYSHKTDPDEGFRLTDPALAFIALVEEDRLDEDARKILAYMLAAEMEANGHPDLPVMSWQSVLEAAAEVRDLPEPDRSLTLDMYRRMVGRSR